MGWKSTMAITRADAVAEITRRLLGAEDDKIEETLEALVDHDNDRLYGYNFQIVPSYDDIYEYPAVFGRGRWR